MKHNLKGEQQKRKLIAIAVIKNCILKDDVKSAIEIAERNHINSSDFGKIVASINN